MLEKERYEDMILTDTLTLRETAELCSAREVGIPHIRRSLRLEGFRTKQSAMLDVSWLFHIVRGGINHIGGLDLLFEFNEFALQSYPSPLLVVLW